MKLGMEVDFRPGHNVLDGHPASPPPKTGTAAPSFPPMSIVSKWLPISAAAELLLHCLFSLVLVQFGSRLSFLVFDTVIN